MGPHWEWLLMVVVLMGSALRGNRSALGLWTVLSGVIGTALVLWGLSVDNGAVRFLGGFLAIAASVVFALLRDELAERPEIGERRSSRQSAKS
jgi:heme A synthase